MTKLVETMKNTVKFFSSPELINHTYVYVRKLVNPVSTAFAWINWKYFRTVILKVTSKCCHNSRAGGVGELWLFNTLGKPLFEEIIIIHLLDMIFIFTLYTMAKILTVDIRISANSSSCKECSKRKEEKNSSVRWKWEITNNSDKWSWG